MSRMTQSAFAKMVGVSRAAIAWQIKTGKLPLVNGKIDTDDPVVANYIALKASEKPKPQTSPNKAPRSSTSVPSVIVSPMDDITEGLSKHQWDTRRAAAATQNTQLKNAQLEGRLVAREVIERGFFIPVETMFNRLLREGAKTIAAKVLPLVKSGAPVEDVEAEVRKRLTAFIRPAKEEMKRAIRLLDEKRCAKT